jgi:hypothetical protein
LQRAAEMCRLSRRCCRCRWRACPQLFLSNFFAPLCKVNKVYTQANRVLRLLTILMIILGLMAPTVHHLSLRFQ